MVNRHFRLFVLIFASVALLTPAALAQTSVAPPAADVGLEASIGKVETATGSVTVEHKVAVVLQANASSGPAQVKVGVPYALALSSPAGIWACLIGNVVQFERLDPPLLRLVETATIGETPTASLFPSPPRIVTAPHPFPPQPPHRRNDDTPAVPPGIAFRSAWSARADRE